MRVMLTGDVAHRDFRRAIDWLESHAELQTAADLTAAAQRLEQGAAVPRLLVVAQSRPGQFSSQQIERLHRAAPLMRIVALLGSWCEGEARSGAPWPGVERVYWHQWPARVMELLFGDGASSPGVWRLPRTATAAERSLAMQAVSTSRPQPLRGLIAIRTSRLVDYEALADACRQWGLSTAWLNPDDEAIHIDGADLLLWDGASGDEREAAALREHVERLRPVGAIALLSFPRIEDHDRMLAAGAVAVLTKPFVTGDLRRELARLLPAATDASTSVA